MSGRGGTELSAEANPSADQMLDRAAKANDQSDWVAAIEWWARGFEALRQEKREPVRHQLAGFAQARLARSDQLAQLKQLEAAEALVNAVLAEAPEDRPARMRSAKLAMIRQDWTTAIERWRSLLSPAGSNPAIIAAVKAGFVEACRKRAMELAASAQPEAALALAREAADRAPSDATMADLLVDLAMARGDWVEAENRLRERLAEDDPPSFVFEKLSDVSCRLGRFAAGEALLRSGLERHPKDGRLRNRLKDFTQFRATALPIWGPRSSWTPGDDRRIATWAEARPRDGRMSVLLAGDTSLRSNWGCRATSAALRSLIHTRAARVDFTVDVAQWGVYFGEIAPEGYTPPEPRDMEKLVEIVRSRPEAPISQALRACDVLVLNGEGAFLDFARAGRLLLSLAYVADRLFGKRSLLVNHTSDLQDPRLRAFAERVYPLLEDVAFREPLSLARSGTIRASLGLPQVFAADAIHIHRLASKAAWEEMCRRGYFAYHPDALRMFDPTQPYIVLGGSARWRFQARPEHDSTSDYVALGQALLKLAPVVVVAVEHQEEPYLRAVAEEIGVPFIGCRLPIPQAIDLVAHAALYVGGRWHTALKGLMGGAPPILLSTNSSYKTGGLLQMYGLQQPELDFYDAGRMVGLIAELAEERLRAGQKERRRLRSIAKAMALSAHDNVRWLPPLGGRTG